MQTAKSLIRLGVCFPTMRHFLALFFDYKHYYYAPSLDLSESCGGGEVVMKVTG